MQASLEAAAAVATAQSAQKLSPDLKPALAAAGSTPPGARGRLAAKRATRRILLGRGLVTMVVMGRRERR
jgi:hypothetical protein